MCCLRDNRNNLHLNMFAKVERTKQIYIGKYYIVWFEIVLDHNDHSKLYICMTKLIENINRSRNRC